MNLQGSEIWNADFDLHKKIVSNLIDREVQVNLDTPHTEALIQLG